MKYILLLILRPTGLKSYFREKYCFKLTKAYENSLECGVKWNDKYDDEYTS